MGRPLRMDVLVPTHNRAALLERCVRSVMRANPSPRLETRVTVICNACVDGSETRVRALQAEFRDRISLIVERPGAPLLEPIPIEEFLWAT